MRSTLVALILIAAMTDRSVGKAPGTEAILAKRLAEAYGGEWSPERIRVDVVAYSNWAGAYTTNHPNQVTISSTDYEDLEGQEMLFHEVSHASFFEQRILGLLATAFRRLGTEPPDSLLHIIQFLTPAELLRSLLSIEELDGYQSVADRVAERSRWRDQYRVVLENWRPFLDGHVERAAALDRIAVGLAPRALPISAPHEAHTPGYRIQTEHLTLEWVEVPGSTEVEAVTAEATKLYERVAELLDERPAGRVTIVLGGPAEKPGGQRDYPRVDSKGRILLFKYVPDFRNYFSALAHEMVHAFRFDRRLSADWFFEEGFAEFVALRVDPSLAGLPWFDFSVTLVAGQWLAERQDIPLSVLRERHHELNLACTAQSYALRSAFFDWLGNTFGDGALLEAAKESPAGTLADYEKFFGEPLEQLERDWRTSLLAEYRAIPDFEGVARTYRTESPIQYQPVCIAGEDF